MNQLPTITPTHPLYGQRLLGIDFGEKVTGLALFCPGIDPLIQPFGRCLGTWKEMLSQIQAVVEQESIGLVILGLPLLPDGQEGSQAQQVRRFAQAVEAIISCPLILSDETLTTAEAKHRMEQSPRYNFKVAWQELDAWSAAIILEDFVRQYPTT